MILKSRPSLLMGDICVPGSKSHTIRAIAIALLAEGKSIIRSPLISADTAAALRAAFNFGAEIEQFDDRWEIHGMGRGFSISEDVINMENSGTSLRVFTALAALSGNPVNFDGDYSLQRRPMHILLQALEDLGAKTVTAGGGCPLTISGPIRGGETRINCPSSQFLTALLLSCPLADGDSVIHVDELSEKPYVEITLDWLERQEIKLDYADDFSEFRIPGGQCYKPFDYVIPADFSTATFPLLAAAITRSEIRIRNLDFSDRQGDKAVFDYFRQMGTVIEHNDEWTVVRGGSLKAVDLDLNATPDALPAMAVAAAFADGKSAIGNVEQARIKECDRIDAMCCELRKMGVELEEFEDGMVISGTRPEGVRVNGHNDHRIVMALAIAGLAADGETIVSGAESAAVTYPDFVEDFQTLGAAFHLADNDN